MRTNKARTATALIAAALVAGVIAVLSLGTNRLVTTSTEWFTTTSTDLVTSTIVVNHRTTVSVYENVEMVGSCTAVSYFAPDTSSYGVNQTATIGTTTYPTSTYVNNTVGYAMTSTSQNLGDRPSDGWTVTICSLHE